VRGDLVKAERLMGDAIGDDKWQGFMNRAESYVRTSQYEKHPHGGRAPGCHPLPRATHGVAKWR